MMPPRSIVLTLALLAAVSSAREVGAAPLPSAPGSAPLLVSLGESITAGEGAADPYPAVMARDLGMRSLDLGAGGGVNVDLAIDREVPRVPHDCAIVTILAGTNDVYPVTRQALPATQIADGFRALVGGVRAACPAARIFVGTIWLDHRPPAFDVGIAAVNDAIRELAGVTVVDVAADPRLHDAAYQAPDGTHPNEAGHALIARAFEAAIIAAPPPAPPLASSLPAVFLTPLSPTRAFVVSGARGALTLGACADKRGRTVAHPVGAGNGPSAVVTLATDEPGRCMLVASDGAGRTLHIPVATYGALTVDRPALTLHLGAQGTDVAVAEPGYYNAFGILSPCGNAAGQTIVHWTKPNITGPSAAETIVPDRLGACTMRVFDFNQPAQIVDVPVVVLP